MKKHLLVLGLAMMPLSAAAAQHICQWQVVQVGEAQPWRQEDMVARTRFKEQTAQAKAAAVAEPYEVYWRMKLRFSGITEHSAKACAFMSGREETVVLRLSADNERAWQPKAGRHFEVEQYMDADDAAAERFDKREVHLPVHFR